MLTNFRVTAVITAAIVLGGCASNTTRPSASAGPPNDANCLTSASRIPGADCSAPGRSYSNQDLQRTGAPTVAGALPLMDPALTVRH